MATDSDQLDYSDPDESPSVGGPSEQSYIKYHVTITNLSLEGRPLHQLVQDVTQQLQTTVGPVQGKYVHASKVGTKANLLLGFERDEDAARLIRGQVQSGVSGSPTITPTDVFAAYLDFMDRRKPPVPAPSAAPRTRSRSPRTDVPVFYLMFPPGKWAKEEILQSLSQAGVTEVPKVDQVFTSCKNVGGVMLKLAFKSQEVIDLLCSSELQVRKKPVLLLQAGQKSSVDSILRAATETYQIVADPGSQSVSIDKVAEAAQRFGTVVNVSDIRGKFYITFCRGFSVREALANGVLQANGCSLSLSAGSQVVK